MTSHEWSMGPSEYGMVTITPQCSVNSAVNRYFVPERIRSEAKVEECCLLGYDTVNSSIKSHFAELYGVRAQKVAIRNHLC